MHSLYQQFTNVLQSAQVGKPLLQQLLHTLAHPHRHNLQAAAGRVVVSQCWVPGRVGPCLWDTAVSHPPQYQVDEKVPPSPLHHDMRPRPCPIPSTPTPTTGRHQSVYWTNHRCISRLYSHHCLQLSKVPRLEVIGQPQYLLVSDIQELCVGIVANQHTSLNGVEADLGAEPAVSHRNEDPMPPPAMLHTPWPQHSPCGH